MNKMSIKNYITNIVTVFGERNPNGSSIGYYKTLLDHGMYFSVSPKPKSMSWGLQKECFANCARRLMTTDRYRYAYVEGLAVSNNIAMPLPHAWLYDFETKRSYDPTWRDGGAQYFGIPFCSDNLLDHLVKERIFGETVSFLAKDLDKGVPFKKWGHPEFYDFQKEPTNKPIRS